MSGRKRIMVDEAEWNRLQQQAANLAHVQRDIPRLMQDVRNQTARDREMSEARFEARQNQVDQALSGLSEQTRTLEADTTRRLRETSRQLRSELSATATDLRQDVEERIRKQADVLRGEIETERQERRQAFDALQAEVSNIQEGTARATEAAVTALRDARILAEAIRALPHERYFPNMLVRLEERLSTAEQDVASGHGSSTLGSARQFVHDLSDLRLDVEERELRRTTIRAAAVDTLVVIQGLIRQNENVAIGATDTEKGVSIDVDHWSRGGLGRLADEVRTRLAQARDDEHPLTEDELRLIIEESAPQYTDRLNAIVAQSGTAVFASQLRANFADLIAEVLQESHYYEYDDSAYTGNDERNGFYSRSVHGNGSAVVVQVEPSPDETSTACDVQILSYDVDVESEATRDSRAESIRTSLKANGIQISGIEEAPGEPEPELLDLDTIRSSRSRRPGPEQQSA